MRVGWEGGGLHIQKSSLPTSRGSKKAHLGLVVLGFGGAAPSKPHHRPCFLLLPLQPTAALSITEPSAVLWGAICNKKLDSVCLKSQVQTKNLPRAGRAPLPMLSLRIWLHVFIYACVCMCVGYWAVAHVSGSCFLTSTWGFWAVNLGGQAWQQTTLP